MDHPFQSSLTDSNICGKCKYDAIMHTNMATCETCPNIGNVEMFAGMAMCSNCISNEMRASLEIQKKEHLCESCKKNVETKFSNKYWMWVCETCLADTDSMNIVHMSLEQQDKRVAEGREFYKNRELERIKTVDQQVQLRTDIFNAETVAIVEIKTIIDNDENITNKPYALACMLSERYQHFKKVIFDLGEQQIEKQNQQRAIQTYLNQLADKLRIEEREKLKISDLSYTPTAPKLTISKPKPRKTFDKAELAKYAGECGLPLATFQMLCVQKNLQPKEMAESFLKITNQVTTKNE